MLSAIGQPVAIPEDPDWVSVERAAELTGDAPRTWRRRAEREDREARGQCRRPLAVTGTAPHRRGRPTWWVHRSLHPKLTRYPDRAAREENARQALCTRYPQHHVAMAYRKAYWLQRWRRLCDANYEASVTERQLAARIVRDAKIVEVETFRISYRSLRNWHATYNTIGANGKILGVEGLIHGCAGLGRADGTGNRSPGASEYFYQLYHAENKIAVAVCHETTVREARRKGWAWPETYAATTRWLKEHDNVSVSFLLRNGRDAWCRRFMPHLEIDYTLIDPSAMMQTDHHQCDFWIEDDGKQLRPWLTVLQDMRSRMIVGWALGPVPQSAGRTRSAVDELRAKGRERVAKLRATGTDCGTGFPAGHHTVADATIIPVRTGFEGCSKAARTAASGPKIDRKARDLSAAQAALGFGIGLSPKEPGRPRVSDDLLRGRPIEQTEAVKDDGDDEGMEAGTQPTDAFSLIASGADRHGPRRKNK